MSEITEYVANSLIRVHRPGGVFIKTYSYEKESLANIQFTIQIHSGDILPDWVHDEEIKALLDRGLIAPRNPSVSKLHRCGGDRGISEWRRPP
jgi:hypothetical protein